MPIGRIFLIAACICFFVKGAGIKTGDVDMAYVGWASRLWR